MEQTQPSPIAEELQILLLGGLRVSRGNTPLAGFVSAKAPALLAYLATTGRPHSRAALASLLWSEVPDALADQSLRHVLFNLRKLVGQHLTITRETVTFNHEAPSFVDVEQFQSNIQHPPSSGSEVARLLAGIALYRGEFLEGFTVRNAPAFDEWIVGQRERLRQLAVHGLHELAMRYMARREFEAAIKALRQLLQLDPWREAAHRQLMRLLAQSGQRDGALKQYQACRHVLELELGVEPEDETTALAEQIRTGALTMPALHDYETARQGNNLPVQPTLLIGRAGALAQIKELLSEPACRLLSLVGPGGVGKTRLALEVASAQRDVFDDGVFLVSLAPIRDPELVAPTIARTLDIRQAGGVPAQQDLQNYLRDKHVLLLLDNFEQVASAAAFIAELLAYCPKLKILVTSRETLHLRGSYAFPVVPLELPDLQHLPPPMDLAEYPAVALFVERARQADPAFMLSAANARAVAEVCVRLDGLPLAIELAAARSKLLPADALLTRLSDRLGLLASRTQDLPERHQTLRAALDWSYHLLDSREQALFRRLGVFVGGCTLEAVEAVVEGDDALDGVASLLDKSLVRQTTRVAGEPRFMMLETIRAYALDRLAASGESEAIRRRHACVFLQLAETAQPHLMGKEQARWLDRLEAEHDNLRAAFQWSLDQGDVEVSLRLSAALWRFWYAHTHLSEGRQWLEAALSAARCPVADNGWSGAAHEHCPHASPFAQPLAAALHGAGVLAYYQSGNDRAQILLDRALAIRRSEPDLAGVAAVLHDLGGVAQMEGDYLRATTLYEESLGLFRKVGDRAGIALSLYRLGTVVYEQGEYSRTATLCEESLLLFRELGDKGSMAAASNTLGAVAQQQQDYGRAAALFEKGLALYRDVHNELGIAWSIGNLAYLAWAQRDYQHAACFFEENLAYYREIGNKQGIADNLRILGNLAHAEDDEARAATLLTQSLALFDELGDKRGIAGVLEGCAAIAAKQGANATGQTGTSALDGERLTARGARLWGAAEVLREELRAPMPSPERQLYEGYVAAARRTVSEAAFVAAWEEGRALTLERAIEYALEVAAAG